MNRFFKFKLPLMVTAIVLVLCLLCGVATAEEPKTLYVDAGYGGGDSDGSFEKPFKKIGEAITKANDGDHISVTAGEYTENVTIGKPITLTGPDSGSDLPLIIGTLKVENNGDTFISIENINFIEDDGDSIELIRAKNVTIKNCHFDCQGEWRNRAVQMKSNCENIVIDNCTFKNGYYVTIQGSVDNLTVKDSTIENCKSGINLQAGTTLVVENTDISVVAKGAANDTYCVRFASSTTNSGKDMSITGGTFTVDRAGLLADAGTYHSAIVIREGATGTLEVKNTNIRGEVVNLSEIILDAKYNWWGDATGPAHVTNPGGKGGTIEGNVEFLPWYVDEDMTTPSSTEINYLETGGTELEFKESGVVLKVKEAGQDGYISVTHYGGDDRDAPEGMVPAGFYLRLERSDSLAGIPVRIEISYNPDDLPDGVAEDDLRLYRYNPEKEQWELISDPEKQGIDKDRCILWAELDEFSEFGVFADASEEPVVEDPEEEEPGGDTPRTSGGLLYSLLLGLFLVLAGFLLIRKEGLQGR